MMELKGKKVLVVGLGKSGLAAALFLRRRGAQVTVSDIRSAEALANDIPALLEEGINVEAGGHGLLTFRRQDMIVVSPGVPLDTPELVQVRNFGLPIIGELELAARFLKGKTLAITGSNGKTTTTTLIGEILKAAGLPTLVAGNIGVPVVSLLEDSTDETWSVLEVSSFQLESTEQFHPQIAVILNITPDHLDRHGIIRELCCWQKSASLPSQDQNDFVVLNADNDRTAARLVASKSQVYWFSLAPPVAQGAWVEARTFSSPTAKDAPVETMMPLTQHSAQGRAQRGERAGCGLCRRASPEPRRNRSAGRSRISEPSSIASSTWPPSTASSSTTTPRPPTSTPRPRPSPLFPAAFISSWAARTRTPTTRCCRICCARGSGPCTPSVPPRQRSSRTCAAWSPFIPARRWTRPSAAAAAAAHPGEIVLLAPACSSFDQFESYEQRGREFKELVHEWRG